MHLSHMPRHAAAVAAVCAVLIGCRQPDAGPPAAAPPHAAPPHAAGAPRLLRATDLSAAERQYGHSASRGPGVTYQPDVVIPPAGASAIRSLSADGLVWTIDPDAEGAADIVPGKVLLLTNRAAGRVLAVEKAGDGLRVVLGPVEITEIIRDGQFSVEQPVDFAQALQLTTPAAFDPQMAVPPLAAARDAGRYAVVPARFRAAANPVTAHQFKLLPYVGSNGVGVRIVSNGGGVQFLGESILYLSAPRVRFALDIRPPGRVVNAEVALIGLGGLQVKFEAAMAAPTDANISEKRFAANDFSIPVGGLGGVPLALTVRQLFQLRTVFTSTGNIKAGGSYTLAGGLSAGYREGAGFSVSGPTGFGAKYTLLPSIEGVAIGVTGLVLTHRVDVMVGIGAAGFVAGPYAHLNSSVSIARGSSVGFDAGVGLMGHGRTCRRESVDMAVGAGIGYQMPQPVTDAINFILSALHIKERIQGRGGLEWKPTIIVSKGWYHPQAPWCGNQ